MVAGWQGRKGVGFGLVTVRLSLVGAEEAIHGRPTAQTGPRARAKVCTTRRIGGHLRAGGGPHLVLGPVAALTPRPVRMGKGVRGANKNSLRQAARRERKGGTDVSQMERGLDKISFP